METKKCLIMCRTGMGSSMMLKIKVDKLIDKNGVLAETGKKIIDAGTNTNGTANGEVKVSVVDLYKSDVANVVVLYTSQAKFGNEDYVFVMPEFDVYNDYFYYTVIHEDGTMEEVKSEENLRNELKGTASSAPLIWTPRTWLPSTPLPAAWLRAS